MASRSRRPRPGDYPPGVVRLLLAHDGGLAPEVRVSSMSEVYALVAPLIGSCAQERFMVLLLNSRHRLLSILSVAEGGASSVQVDLKMIFAGALLAGASCLILCHNHPSGDPSPSPEDQTLTQRIMAGASLLGFRVLDHVIIGKNASLHSMNGANPSLFGEK